MVGVAANSQHLFALYLQLSGQSVDGLVKRVDFVVQIGDAVATGTQLGLQVGDANQEFLLLKSKTSRSILSNDHFRTSPGGPNRNVHGYLLVAVLHRLLQFPLSCAVFLEVDLLQVLDGRGVEVVQFCSERCCQTDVNRDKVKDQMI